MSYINNEEQGPLKKNLSYFSSVYLGLVLFPLKSIAKLSFTSAGAGLGSRCLYITLKGAIKMQFSLSSQILLFPYGLSLLWRKQYMENALE